MNSLLLPATLLFVLVLNCQNINGQTYACSNYNTTGCTFSSSYYNDGDCDCTDCSDESNWDCSTCSGGCPTSCGGYTSCDEDADSVTSQLSDGYEYCDDYSTTGCYYSTYYYNDNYCDCADCSDEPDWNCNNCDGGCPSTCFYYTSCYQSAYSYDEDDSACPDSTLEDGFQIGDIVDLASCASSFCENDGAVGVITKLVSQVGLACDALGGFLNIIDILNGNSDDVDPGVGIVATCWESSVVTGSRANFSSFAKYLESTYNLGATNEDVLTDSDEYTEYSVELSVLATDDDADDDSLGYYNMSMNGTNDTYVEDSSEIAETFTSLGSNNQFISAIYDSTGTTKAEMISTAITNLMLDLTDRMDVATVMYNWTDEGFNRVLRSSKGVLFVDNEVGDKDFQFFVCEANIVTNDAKNTKSIVVLMCVMFVNVVLCRSV